jgi:hypothetical protein
VAHLALPKERESCNKVAPIAAPARGANGDREPARARSGGAQAAEILASATEGSGWAVAGAVLARRAKASETTSVTAVAA